MLKIKKSVLTYIAFILFCMTTGIFFDLQVYYLFFVSEIFIILFSYRNFGFTNMLFLSTVVYNTFFTLAYILQSYYGVFENSFSRFLFEDEFLEDSISKFAVFKISFNLFYLLFYKKFSYNPYFVALNNIKSLNVNRIVYYFLLPALSLLLLFIQIAFGIGIQNLLQTISQGDRFLINNPTLSNAIYSILLILLFITSYEFVKNYRLINFVPFVIVFVSSMFYPYVNSSRSLSIPFAFLSGLNLFFGRVTLSVIFFLLSILSLNFAFIKRRGVEILEFVHLINLWEMIYSSLVTISNIPTLTKTIYGLEYDFIRPNIILNVLIYPFSLLPIPAVFFGEFFQRTGGLTYHFNFPLGITADIVSESLLLFGNAGPLIFGAMWGSVIAFTEKFISYKNINNILRFILWFSLIYFIFSTCAYPTRHSSRFLVYTLTIYFLYKTFYHMYVHIINNIKISRYSK